MKKTIIILIIFLCAKYGYSQKAISVDYEVFFSIDEKIEKNTRIKNLYEIGNSGSKLSNFKLDIYNNEANFYANEYNGLNKDLWETTLILADYQSKLYINNDKKEVIFNNNDDLFKKDTYLVSKKNDYEWTINYADSLRINDYLCFKATCFEEVKFKNSLAKSEVTAWFCPELPYQFGPNGYGLLPGLILQINSNRTNFYMKKISYIDNISIDTLIKSNLITEDDYDNLLYTKSRKIKGLD